MTPLATIATPKFLLILLFITEADSFTVPSRCLWSNPRYTKKSRDVSSGLKLLWFGNDDKKKSNQNEDTTSEDKPKQSKMGSTAKTMENFKQSQELGKKTSALLNELSATSIEGVAARGKIRVTVDGQQLPKIVDVDEDYFNSVTVEDFTEALVQAMQDAHVKSNKVMEEKMNGLYADLGLPLTKN